MCDDTCPQKISIVGTHARQLVKEIPGYSAALLSSLSARGTSTGPQSGIPSPGRPRPVNIALVSVSLLEIGLRIQLCPGNHTVSSK